MKPLKDSKIINSLKRYFAYQDISSKSIVGLNFILYIQPEEIIIGDKINNENKSIFFSIHEFQDESIINCLDFNNLKDNFKLALNSDEQYTLLKIKEVRNKISLFFKGHGEKSLFDSLNWTNYYILNGVKQYINENLDWESIKKTYLQKGIENWNKFKKRVDKYEFFINIIGFKNEMESINTSMKNFDIFFEKIKDLDKRRIKKIKLNELGKNIEILNYIDNILIRIKDMVKEHEK